MLVLFLLLGRDSHLLKKDAPSSFHRLYFQPEATTSNSSLLFRRKRDKEAKNKLCSAQRMFPSAAVQSQLAQLHKAVHWAPPNQCGDNRFTYKC